MKKYLYFHNFASLRDRFGVVPLFGRGDGTKYKLRLGFFRSVGHFFQCHRPIKKHAGGV